MNRLFLTAFVGIIAVSPVGAADYSNNYSPVMDWTGFYAGVLVGYGVGQAVTDTTGVSTTIPQNGAIAGATVGFNQQVDRLVFGVEADFDWSGQSGSATCVLSPANTCNGDADWVGSARGRVGYAVDRALFYGTAGAAFMRGNATITPPVGGLTNTFSDNYLGWTVGVGAEFAMTDTLSLKAEYDYADYGSRTAPAGTLAGPATTINATSHFGKIGLNFHF